MQRMVPYMVPYAPGRAWASQRRRKITHAYGEISATGRGGASRRRARPEGEAGGAAGRAGRKGEADGAGLTGARARRDAASNLNRSSLRRRALDAHKALRSLPTYVEAPVERHRSRTS